MKSTKAAAAAAPALPASAVQKSFEKMQPWIKKWFNEVETYKAPESQCIFRFGVCTDAQYADIDDGKSFIGRKRYYRNALVMLKRAFDCWYFFLSCLPIIVCERATIWANEVSLTHATSSDPMNVSLVICPAI